MAALIDASLWIDFSRARSPRSLKQFIAPFILDPDACLAEPVAFEVLRNATVTEYAQLTQQFQTLPMLPTPADLWSRAAELGRQCRHAGTAAGSLDLQVAVVAIAHGAELVTFDNDFQRFANISPLRVKLLTRP